MSLNHDVKLTDPMGDVRNLRMQNLLVEQEGIIKELEVNDNITVDTGDITIDLGNLIIDDGGFSMNNGVDLTATNATAEFKNVKMSGTLASGVEAVTALGVDINDAKQLTKPFATIIAGVLNAGVRLPDYSLETNFNGEGARLTVKNKTGLDKIVYPPNGYVFSNKGAGQGIAMATNVTREFVLGPAGFAEQVGAFTDV